VVATTTFMLARLLIMAAVIKAMRKAGLVASVLEGNYPPYYPGRSLR
jgi:hypothetical protein